MNLSEYLKLGVPIEFLANAIETDVGLATIDTGVLIYLDPMENLAACFRYGWVPHR